jgi:hypothetical protein
MTESAESLTQVAESWLQDKVGRIENYASVRIDRTTWLVVFSAERKTAGMIPQFLRVRIVKLGADGRLNCSDGHFECNGIPCSHCAHVSFKHGAATFQKYTHLDVSVRWWKAFFYWTIKKRSLCSDKERSIKDNFLFLQDNDIKGPRFVESELPPECEYPIYRYGANSTAVFQEPSTPPMQLFKRKLSADESALN